MEPVVIVNLTIKAMMLVLLVSAPPIVVAAITGFLVSLFQSLTQIQEQTLSFAVKLIAVALTLLVVSHWLGAEVYNFTLTIFDTLAMQTK